MTKDELLGIVRHGLTFVGGILLTKGIIDEGLYLELSGAFTTLVGIVWSIFNKRNENKKVD
jgi:hypothetical protein